MNATTGSETEMACLPFLQWLHNSVTKLPWKKKNSNRISSLPQNKQFQWYNLEGVSFSDFKAVLNGDSVAGDKRLKEKLFSRKSNGLGLTNLGSTSSLPLGNCKSSKS